MKRVSFKTAQAIKEAGYPQYFEEFEDYGYFMNGNHPQIYNHDENDCPMYYHILCVAPTYLEVWLWLWREKKCRILLSASNQWWNEVHGVVDGVNGIVETSWHKGLPGYDATDHHADYNDPEDAIIAAIEHLVDNNLIKM